MKTLPVAAAAALLALLSGCQSLAPRAQTSFADSLAACQFFRGGRPGADRERAANDPAIEPCLRRRGWAADGSPTLDHLLGQP